MANAPAGKSYDQLFEVIAGEAIMGILVFDAQNLNLESKAVYINRVASEALEVNVWESENEPTIGEFIPDQARAAVAPLFSLDLLQFEGLSNNVLIRKRSGHVIMANVSIKHVRPHPTSLLRLVMFQDVTIQNKLQRDLEAKQDEIHDSFAKLLEQNRQLLELDQAKDRFIALTTHELRTPLSAIVATSDVLRLKLYESDLQRDEFIQTIHEQGLHLLELVNDILDFAKIRAGKMEFFVENFEIAPFVRKIANSFDTMAAQDRIMIVHSGEQTGAAYADTLRLKEVVSNVVNNAVKYNHEGGLVKISYSLWQSRFRRITVTDTGPGISADKMHHVFNEFETVGHISKHQKGTGLGMPISRRLMQAMGGDLTFESEVGKGTSFFIDIPVERVLKEEMYVARSNGRTDPMTDQMGDALADPATAQAANKTRRTG